MTQKGGHPMDQILRIHMGPDGAPTTRSESMGDYAGLGGRALTTAIVAKEVPPQCHALGAENKLVIAPGLLSGTIAAMSGRLSVGCKSPLTGTIKEANAGGQAAQVQARLGYAAIAGRHPIHCGDQQRRCDRQSRQQLALFGKLRSGGADECRTW